LRGFCFYQTVRRPQGVRKAAVERLIRSLETRQFFRDCKRLDRVSRFSHVEDDIRNRFDRHALVSLTRNAMPQWLIKLVGGLCPTIDRTFDGFGQSPRLLCSPRLIAKRIDNPLGPPHSATLFEAQACLRFLFSDESHAQILKAMHPAHQRCCEKSRKGRFAIQKPYEFAAAILQGKLLAFKVSQSPIRQLVE
jgi:hypothetical protein